MIFFFSIRDHSCNDISHFFICTDFDITPGFQIQRIEELQGWVEVCALLVLNVTAVKQFIDLIHRLSCCQFIT